MPKRLSAVAIWNNSRHCASTGQTKDRISRRLIYLDCEGKGVESGSMLPGRRKPKWIHEHRNKLLGPRQALRFLLCTNLTYLRCWRRRCCHVEHFVLDQLRPEASRSDTSMGSRSRSQFYTVQLMRLWPADSTELSW